MKVKVLGLIFVLILWVFLNFSKNDGQIKESALPSPSQGTSSGLAFTKLQKIETHAPMEDNIPTLPASSPKIETPDSVPWKELEARWGQELKDYLRSLDQQEGDKMFREYSKSKKDFQKQVQIISEKMNATYKYDPEKDDIVFSDRLAYQKFNDQINEELKFHQQRTKKIFGKHYQEVSKFYQDFTEAAQAYHSGEGRIGIDPSFNE